MRRSRGARGEKDGGSSVADADGIKRVAQRIVATRKGGDQVVVVVSAMGDSTDELMDLASQVSPLPPARELDMLLTAGERISMALLAMATGLRLLQAELANRGYEPPPVRTSSTMLDGLIAEGRTGVNVGKGYFDWGGRSAEELFGERDRKLLTLKRALRAIGPMSGEGGKDT